MSLLARYPAEAQAAYTQFLQTRSPDDADQIVLAVIRQHIPRKHQPPAGQPLPETARLMADLGYDSLAIAEVVFLFEDLFKVRITQAELTPVRTVSDLRSFVRRKLEV